MSLGAAPLCIARSRGSAPECRNGMLKIHRNCSSSRILRWSSVETPGVFCRQRLVPERICLVAAAVFFCSEGGSGKKLRRRAKDVLDVEQQILKFMQQSEKPGAFPSKQELIDAGRSDLVEAAIQNGGWITIGWDAEEKRKELQRQVEKCRSADGTLANGCSLNGLKKLLLEPTLELPLESEVSKDKRTPDEANEMASTIAESSAFRERYDTSELDSLLQRARANIDSFKGELNGGKPKRIDADKTVSHEATERWRRKRRKETEKVDSSTVNNALDWIKDMVDKREQLILQVRSKSSKPSEEPPSVRLPAPIKAAVGTNTVKGTQKQQPKQSLPEKPSEDAFSARIRNLETKLVATRAALKSGRTALLKGEEGLMQIQKRSGEDLAKASDSMEFKESEIMQARSELRKTQAEVTALQAKFAVELSEARKSAEEKRVLLEKAEHALRMMRPVRLVWPSPAIQVLVMGSFDGWTNKIPMERTGAGAFALNLHLYPGRYEIKFIVDGSWKVDPCRPVTHAGGNENNLLMVS